MGIQLDLFSKFKRKDEPPERKRRVGTISRVRDSGGKVIGIWLSDSNKERLLNNLSELAGLVSVLGGEEQNIFSGNYRIVPNNADSNGGCFLMFDRYMAPGE